MEDKSFELLTKMYNEFSKRFDGVDKEIRGLKNDIIRLEDKVDTRTKALFDVYKLLHEDVSQIRNKVDEISEKVEKQDLEIRVIRGAK